MRLSTVARTAILTLAAGASLLGAWVFFVSTTPGGASWLDWLRTTLIGFTLFWLVLGTSFGLLGALLPTRRETPEPQAPPQGRTAILMPVYNEDPKASFARVAAMNRDLIRLGVANQFDFAVLSDTNDLTIAAQETDWFEKLLREPCAEGRLFYRRRENNIGRKAGNIEDFIVRAGGAYDYALILDADSLMAGETIIELALRMEADSRLGLLQTLPRVINARSFFGRCMQFAAAYFSPHFARGAALLHGDVGPYWGHNAMVRTRAFADCCGLPELSGPAPHGGHILSHDYVEAALLARGGWRVRVDPHLGGSYEEGPDNLIEYAKRDRRWCQGNLQHRRVVTAPRLLWWSRFTLVQGIMAYLASPLWLAFLVASVYAAVSPERVFADIVMLRAETALWSLAIAILFILVLPKLLILARGLIGGRNRRVGGSPAAFASVFLEVIFTTILAPVMLLLQTRSVIQTLLGTDNGWPAARREGSRLTLSEGFAASWWIMAVGATSIATTMAFAPELVVWILPVTVPALSAPLLIAWSSLEMPARSPILATAESLDPPAIIRSYRALLSNWSGESMSTHANVVNNDESQRVSA